MFDFGVSSGMASYEITLAYPDQLLDRMNRAFLASVVSSAMPILDGFRSCQGGVALTFVVKDARDEDMARNVAHQRARGIWPNFTPAVTESTSVPSEAGLSA